jgi:hypothetical protein
MKSKKLIFQTIVCVLLLSGCMLAGCRKAIEEPKHKNKGKDVIYLKIDDQEFLIKEGFSWNKNVVRADIVGPFDDEKANYSQFELNGSTASRLSFALDKKAGPDYLSLGNWRLAFFEDATIANDLPNSVRLTFVSIKHRKRINVFEDNNSSSSTFTPTINILEHDKERKIISGTQEFEYKDVSDTNIRGNFYMYFRLNYEKG